MFSLSFLLFTFLSLVKKNTFNKKNMRFPVVLPPLQTMRFRVVLSNFQHWGLLAGAIWGADVRVVQTRPLEAAPSTWQD